jgi:hypothetical protein
MSRSFLISSCSIIISAAAAASRDDECINDSHRSTPFSRRARAHHYLSGRQTVSFVAEESINVAYDKVPTGAEILLACIHPFPQNRALDVFCEALAQYLLDVALWHDQISFRHDQWCHKRIFE